MATPTSPLARGSDFSICARRIAISAVQPIVLNESRKMRKRVIRRRCIESSLFVSVGLVRTILATVLALTAFLFALPVSAHDFSASYSTITVDGVRVQIQFTLNLIDLHEGPQ